MKIFLLISLIGSSLALADDCKTKLNDLNQKSTTVAKLDQHVAFQVTAAANRIAKKSVWKESPQVLRIEEEKYKSEFSNKDMKLVLFYDSHAEVFGYIKNSTYWCMKDK